MSDENSGDDKMSAILDGIGGISKACDSMRSEMDEMKGRMDAIERGMGATAADKDKRDVDGAIGGTAQTAADADDDDLDDPKVLTKLTPEERRKRDGLARSAKMDAQARCDSVAQRFCESAPPPMAGERVMDYRRRLARAWQAYSDEFKNVDLDKLPGQAFKAIEGRIYADAVHADQKRVVPNGQLREQRKTLPSGHVEVTWVGSPIGWMRNFAGNGQRATGDWKTSLRR